MRFIGCNFEYDRLKTFDIHWTWNSKINAGFVKLTSELGIVTQVWIDDTDFQEAIPPKALSLFFLMIGLCSRGAQLPRSVGHGMIRDSPTPIAYHCPGFSRNTMAHLLVVGSLY